MKRLVSLVGSLVLLVGAIAPAQASPAPLGPPSGSDVTINTRPIARPSHPIVASHLANPTFRVRSHLSAASTAGYRPAQILHAYGVDQLGADGAGQVIGIVDAYDDPSIAGDLQAFIDANQLGGMNGLPGASSCSVALGPHPCFQKVYSAGLPSVDSNWGIEISLDVEWSHVVAPGTDILLVEAPSSDIADLLGGVDTAVNDGARVVSMSWGTGEYSSETADDNHFNRSDVTFVAAAGDSGAGVLWPATSPEVIAVGGTTLSLDSFGNILAETAWSGSGGGTSSVEAEPGYQSRYGITSGGKRGGPDVAYDADPNTGITIYDTTSYSGMTGWFEVGGTSAGAPQWAALLALVGQLHSPLTSASASTSPLYNAASAAYGTAFRDVTGGSDGFCPTCQASVGYDFVTGLGSPRATGLATSLGAQSSPPAPEPASPPIRLPPE